MSIIGTFVGHNRKIIGAVQHSIIGSALPKVIFSYGMFVCAATSHVGARSDNCNEAALTSIFFFAELL